MHCVSVHRKKLVCRDQECLLWDEMNKKNVPILCRHDIGDADRMIAFLSTLINAAGCVASDTQYQCAFMTDDCTLGGYVGIEVSRLISSTFITVMCCDENACPNSVLEDNNRVRGGRACIGRAFICFVF